MMLIIIVVMFWMPACLRAQGTVSSTLQVPTIPFRFRAVCLGRYNVALHAMRGRDAVLCYCAGGLASDLASV